MIEVDSLSTPLLLAKHLALSKLKQRNRQDDVLRLKSLHGDITIKNDLATVLDIKHKVCMSTPFVPADLIFISNGTELHDDCSIQINTWCLVRTNANSIAEFNVNVSVDGVQKNFGILKFPVSIKIFHLKRELQKITKIKSMRVIVGGRILRDENLLGDYLLCSAKRQHAKYSRDFTIFVTKVIDLRREIDLVVTLLGGGEVKEKIELGLPLGYLREIMWRHHQLPKDLPLRFAMIVSGSLLELDPKLSLLDYGVDGNEKEVNLFMLPFNCALAKLSDLCEPVVDFLPKLQLVKNFPVAASSSKQPPCRQGLPSSVAQQEVHETASNVSAKPKEKKKTSSGGLFKNFKKGFLSSNSSSSGSVNQKKNQKNISPDTT